ncbi:GT2 family glycosyltransferase [Geodermatophilus tzadiensis]|uniref:GT2 family glycosyltransferase n=1 Tax=Geodermatophilus tzadiensis TaxID=1137988 RepID=A0A2T0TUL4_9ACTN|nr:glycosyltransferase [Geodermatophilus tzadiensis]PRY49343.1 GT2 family glycosyltransferase [Geodermatophilus tzadiensis]
MTVEAPLVAEAGAAPPTAARWAGPLGVVVVNYGSSALLRRNLVPLGRTGLPVVVVDNLSTPEERRAVTGLAAEEGWELVALPDNRGFGAGVNAGVAAARAQGCTTVLLLNPDAVVERDVVDRLAERSLADPLALLSPRIVDSAGGVYFAGSRLRLRDGRTGRRAADPAAPATVREWLTGACLVVHGTLFDLLGGLDDSYFLYWEDVDLSYRAQLAGGRTVLCDDLVAVHDEGGTQHRRGTAKSDLYYYWNCRNRLAFAARHLGRRAMLGWLLRTPAAGWEVVLRGGRRQLLHSPRPLLAAARGSLAGAALVVRAVLRPAARHRRPPVLVVHPGADLYGADRMLLESVDALRSEFDVTVAVPGPGPLVGALEARGVRVVRCPMPVLRNAALRPRGAVRLAADAVRGVLPALRLVRRHGAAGVYVNTVTVPTWPLLARLARRPCVVHVHEAERSLPGPLRRALALSPALATRVLVNSGFTHEVLTEVAPRLHRRSTVLHNAVRGPAAPVPARPRPHDPVRLLFVGRLSPRKGPQVAVAALADLVARGVDARLDLVGSVFPGYEWFEAELRAQVVAAGVADRVAFLGFRPDVAPALAAADVVLVPSVAEESFGNAAVEAVLAARPLVVSDSSGLREAVAGFGSVQVVAPGRPAAWADAVERLLADWPRVRDLAVADAAEARRRHAPERYRAGLVATVAALTGAPGRPSPARAVPGPRRSA